MFVNPLPPGETRMQSACELAHRANKATTAPKHLLMLRANILAELISDTVSTILVQHLLPEVKARLQRVRPHDSSRVGEMHHPVHRRVMPRPHHPAATIRIAGLPERHPIPTCQSPMASSSGVCPRPPARPED